MYAGRTIFSQIMDVLPLRRFHTCVRRYQGNRKVKQFTCLDQFRVMAFAQLTYRQSLRDIEVCLRAIGPKLYHMGIGSLVSRNTLANANEMRDWRIYADLTQILINKARPLYADEDFGEQLRQATLYALDASTIDLCLSLFPWAHFRKTKAAIKLHTLMDMRGNIPTFIHVSEGKLHDVNAMDLLIPEPGAFYVMDRGYLDFARLFTLHQTHAFFVTRAKSNLQCRRRYSHPVDKTTGLICDQTICLTSFYPARHYPQPLRRIRYIDPVTDKRFVFLTNHFDLPALTIAQLYKARWRIELFFKWIKQHLRIKAFYGTSLNAVQTQIWIAITTYLLVAILKKELNLQQDLYTILQVLSVCVFEKTPILQVFLNPTHTIEKDTFANQLRLFD
ncbi:MAG: IS4 family transposase [Phycisphaeraceae bacterium]|nr:IS4 family transposase [Phycisphaeraceae bacterium]